MCPQAGVATEIAIAAAITTHETGAKHRWTLDKLRKGAGPGVDPVEVTAFEAYYQTRQVLIHMITFAEELFILTSVGTGIATGTIPSRLYLQTGVNINSSIRAARSSNPVFGGDYILSFNYPRRVKYSIALLNDTNQVIHIVNGDITVVGAIANTATHFGFKIENGTLYATCAMADTESTDNLGAVSAGDKLELEAILNPDVPEVYFYKDNILVSTLNTNVPTGAPSAASHLFNVSIDNTIAVNKELYVREFRFLQTEIL